MRVGDVYPLIACRKWTAAASGRGQWTWARRSPSDSVRALAMQCIPAACGLTLAVVCVGMVLVFGVEFQEVRSTLRSRRTQGGGVHGNAILSKFDVTAAWCVPHTHQPFSWPKWGHLLRQPRRGGRCFVGAELRTGLAAMPLLRAYSVHLECVAGAHGRLRQLGEVLQHSASRRRLRSATGAGGAPASRHVPVLIGGDANTLLTGVMKTNPMYWDRWTLPCLGMTEAKLWHQLLPIRTNHQPHIPHFGPWSPSLPRELVQGARDARLDALLEPFDPDRDTTTRGMAGAWTAKLDWLMLGGTCTVKGSTLKISNAATGGSGASDHEWVCYDVGALNA